MSKPTNPAMDSANKAMGFGTPGTFEAQTPAPVATPVEEQALVPVTDGVLAGGEFSSEAMAVLYPVKTELQKIPLPELAPFVCFYHTNSKRKDVFDRCIPHADERTVAIIRREGEEEVAIELPSSFKFTLFNCQQYLAHVDIADGAHSEVEFDADPWGQPKGEKRKKENVLSILAVDTGTEFYFTCSTFRQARAKALKQHWNVLMSTQSDAWVTKAVGEEQAKRFALADPKNNIPFQLRMWSTLKQGSKPSKSSDFSYPTAEAIPRTADFSRMQEFAQFFVSTEGKRQLEEVVKAFNDRIAYLQENM